MTDLRSHPVRYPLRAKLGVAAASLLVLAQLCTFGLLMMPLFPLVPVFVCVMLGNAFVLADVVRWAASLGAVEPHRVPRGETAGPAQSPRAAQAAHAT